MKRSLLYSPLTAEKIASDTKTFAGIFFWGNRLYYAENRGDRCTVISAYFDGTGKREELPEPYSAKTRINIYGGVAFIATDNGLLFADAETKAICLAKGGKVIPLVESQGWQYADFDYCAKQQCVVYVAEQTTGHYPRQKIDKLCLKTGTVRTVASTADFYHAPKIYGHKIAWLEWDRQHMPWDKSCIVENIEGETHIRAKQAAHFQPSYDAKGHLHYASDKTGYFNIYRRVRGGELNVYHDSRDFAYPLWTYGMRTFDFCKDSIVAAGVKNGEWVLGHIKNIGGSNVFVKYNTDFVTFDSVRACGNTFAFIGGRTDNVRAVVCVCDGVEYKIAVEGRRPLPKSYISKAVSIWFDNKDKEAVQAYYYPPRNWKADPAEEGNVPPPLIVKAHGGPTGQSDSSFKAKIQFWTSRGFAVLDVNYSGSTGFGRAYRTRLNGKWGLLDASELERGALYCVEKGLADRQRLVISGSSAGGFLVLCALGGDTVFKAGCCLYGISNLADLREKTHKFESQYFDSLIAPYWQCREEYKKRSPLFHAHNISVPVLFLQGLEDKVVPPQQAQDMYEKLKRNGVETFLINFEGEAHGFKNPGVVARALQIELSFYARIFGYSLNTEDMYVFAKNIQKLNIPVP